MGRNSTGQDASQFFSWKHKKMLAKGGSNYVHIGSTYVRLYSRVCQHQGKSHRTGERLTSPVASSIRDHSLECDTPYTIDDFKIIDQKRSNFNLRILESLYIFKKKPSLNDKSSAFKLGIVVWEDAFIYVRVTVNDTLWFFKNRFVDKYD